MNSAEIKLDLFRKLDGLSGSKLQEAYGLLLNFINQNSADFWDDLTPKQQEAIKQGVKELDEGKGVPHDEIMQTLRAK
tara:strand:- start:3515 stop:3748 length:234 start_codon:yes stop_codon:yes gene_type:complete